jgi:hypothetical protein
VVDALLAQVQVTGPARVALTAGDHRKDRHPLAGIPPVDPRAEAGHHTGELVAEHVPGRDHLGRHAQHVQVRAADAAVPDIEQHLADARDRAVDVHHGHAAVVGDRDSSHRLSSSHTAAGR